MLVDHIRDVHVTTEASTPLTVKRTQSLNRSISGSDCLTRNLTSHQTRVDRKTDTLAHQRRAMTTSVTGQDQTIAGKALNGTLRREEASMIFQRTRSLEARRQLRDILHDAIQVRASVV